MNRNMAKSVIDSVKKTGRTFLMEHEAYEVLSAYGFPIVESYHAATATEAVNEAKKIGFPVVLKIASPNVLHKFDLGGVKLNLNNLSEVKRAFQDIMKNIRMKKPDADIKGVIVEKMAPPGMEVILGMSRDSQFGPILMFGLGGIYVEVFKDVTFRLAPIRELTASIMISKTKAHKILKGFRGEPPYDTDAIEDCIKRLSQLVIDFKEIKELDINPLLVFEKSKGCLILDAHIILS